MTHWREMDAGRELDWLIAEKLGWKNLKEWRYGRTVEIHGAPPDSDLRHATLPYYSADLNAAITLWARISDDYTPRLVRMLTPRNGEIRHEYKAGLTSNQPPFAEFDVEYASTPALAVCRAWLAYMEAQERNDLASRPAQSTPGESPGRRG